MKSWLKTSALLLYMTQGTVGPLATASEDLTRYEVALNEIRTLEADFVESTSYGESSKGRLYFARPSRGSQEAFGKLRLVYSPPKAVEVIADGKNLVHVDKASNEASGSPIASTPVAFLLKPHISLKDGITVQQVQHGDNLTAITVYQKENPDAGNLTLFFLENPIRLQRWVVTDLQGVQTEVNLENIKTNHPLAPHLFLLNKNIKHQN